MAKVVDEGGQSEDTGGVEHCGSDHCCPEGQKGIAVVHESFVSKRRDRKTLLHVTGHDPGKKELEDKVAGVHFPCIQVGTGILDRL
jgi:hypothetical protein